MRATLFIWIIPAFFGGLAALNRDFKEAIVIGIISFVFFNVWLFDLWYDYYKCNKRNRR